VLQLSWGWEDLLEGNYWITTYDRENSKLHDADFSCGCAVGWKAVTDEAILSMVASERGFQHLEELGCPAFP